MSETHDHDHDHGHDHAHSPDRFSYPHPHDFLGRNHARNERRAWIVIAITVLVMVVEIVGGELFGSMALLADGWHMATDAGAILVSALAYGFARRYRNDPRFTFGTGQFGDLAAFSSAIILLLVSVFLAVESFRRFFTPVPIAFDESIAVAVLGLIVNIACAFLLHDHGHDHDHPGHSHAGHDHSGHDHSGHGAHHGSEDRNLKVAYLHMVADAITSLTAIIALALGALYGWVFLDPVMGLVGAAVIGWWSLKLLKDTGLGLLHFMPHRTGLPDRIRTLLEKGDTRISDLHVWQLGPGHYGVIVSLRTSSPLSVAQYRERLSCISELSHVTVEVDAASSV
ncbi:CDF family Co(II)/Ni(II) efflux transporter DmeF [Allorhizobium sp. BGMRC 0089]|uniref:CDF family Co(II)/Ni(II) efflux transporter DmeF n=1 Tax=Allorhizobium sonneratiae TaxID=2934936 RepID=UPI002033CA00|nr:CDF family Co(II)/Ni(II) efflux transporter DmeF [Allorhizobium sonneratiae]MCM2294554.1 CDF family Co(II)/Ni(II) efflux transporter DmeF [Allorhizobium sonneratiae]